MLKEFFMGYKMAFYSTTDEAFKNTAYVSFDQPWPIEFWRSVWNLHLCRGLATDKSYGIRFFSWNWVALLCLNPRLKLGSLSADESS